MKIAFLLFSLAVVAVCHADCTPPADYKQKIESLLASRNPQYRKIYCDYYEPKRVLVGDSKEERCAVRCDWGAKLKSGAIPLMIVRSIFLFDGDAITAAERDEKIEWVDGEPMPEMKKKSTSRQNNARDLTWVSCSISAQYFP